jgi:hypothetical protein
VYFYTYAAGATGSLNHRITLASSNIPPLTYTPITGGHQLLDDDIDYLPAVLGMATGFMVEKSANKARNLLRRVGSLEVKSADGEDFEKANLLLAKFYIDKGNYQNAQVGDIANVYRRLLWCL